MADTWSFKRDKVSALISWLAITLRAPASEQRTNNATETETNMNCSFVVPSGDASSVAKPSERLFKRKIFDLYDIIANGTGSAPLKVV
jgi:hypothetical protein